MDAVFSELRRSIPVIQTKPPTAKTMIKASFCFLGIWTSHNSFIGKTYMNMSWKMLILALA
jgi:hypothetical protein